jgi:hypothetical protein
VHEAGLDAAPARGLAVDRVEAVRDPPGPAGRGVELHPRRRGVDAPAVPTDDGDPTLGVVAAGPGAPRGDLDGLEVPGERGHLEHSPPDDPGLGVGQVGVGGVVSRDVLEVPRRGVEAKPAGRADIAQAHGPGALEDTARRRPRDQLRRGGSRFR